MKSLNPSQNGNSSQYYRFPPELLDQPAQVRLDYFKKPDITVMHHNLITAYNQAHRAIREPAGASILMVIGPSGVGKSTLLRLLIKKILEESLEQMTKAVSWLPIVSVNAPAPGRGTFRWKNLYLLILTAVDEPGIDQKINYHNGNIVRGADGVLRIAEKVTEDALRLAMIKALTHRKPYVLAVDEFQHIGKMAGPEQLEAHMDCVKSAVDASQVPWMGFGTYQLLKFLNLSPQLRRRTKTIHFGRYRLEIDSELKEFKRVLEHFQHRLAFSQPPPLRQKYWEFCYERSIGNIGTLKDWLTDAYDLALSEAASTLTLDHLIATAKPASDCERMAIEAIDGEEALTDSRAKQNQLRLLLGLTQAKSQQQPSPPQVATDIPLPTKQVSKKFKRNPKRDPIKK
ncbi:ATP-binding protein [Dendronalium sp. ChiSLP03b]|uniref:ATP-binding protein n=1 Tax=Dendronalium sp. ChiSLP03b TaxID=3075381 RepID=UPI002AD5018F|nr:ATP-binding protein [Dendronalium sp. ChiSLP03b]MDZ8203544.1 ATP-binding protein [Dendronalium sp. ChiSLP03b]